MSTPQSSNDIDAALPRAGVVSYFRTRQPAATPNTPPPYEQQSSDRTPLLPQAVNADEESQCGFWGEQTPEERESRYKFKRVRFADQQDEINTSSSCWRFLDILNLVCYMLLVLALVLNLDVFLSRRGIVSGMMDWSTFRFGGQTVNVQEIGNEMHFCLVTPNREAPGPRTWRYMALNSNVDCTTEIVTLMAGPTERWKLLPDDGFLVAGVWSKKEDVNEGKSRSQRIEWQGGVVKNLDLDLDLGDDLAEEGKLSQSGGDAVHAGFGGHWE